MITSNVTILTRNLRCFYLIVLISLCLVNSDLFSQDYNLAKISPPDGAAYDQFGYSLAAWEDYAVIGAHRSDNFKGAVYVYKKGIKGWSMQQKLMDEAGRPFDFFGRSVAISGEYLVVGAYGHDESGVNSGAVYVFRRSGEEWKMQEKVKAPDMTALDYFGWSVAIDGDNLVVGAYRADEKRGAVYVFNLQNGAWNFRFKMTASDAVPGDVLGVSVAIYKNEIIAGAHHADNLKGAAYIFEISEYGWVEQAKLIAADGNEEDFFGYSVSIFEDKILVGAPYHNYAAGAAYVFTKTRNQWKQEGKLIDEKGYYQDNFGFSVAMGKEHALVGAPWGGVDCSNCGVAILFEKGKSSWGVEHFVRANDGDDENFLGGAVAWTPDYIIAGAFKCNENGEASGAVYAFDLTSEIKSEVSRFNDGSNEILIYPNPAKNYINVDVGEYVGKKIGIIIYDVTGRQCFSGEFNFVNSPLYLDLERFNLKPGVFVLKVIVEGRVYSTNVVKV